MERCDFSSISTCLKNQISESNQMNQPDFLYELFEDFMNDPINEDFSMDNGLICRWITGQAKISPKITSYYAKPSNQKKLATTIQRNLLPLMADCNMVIQDIYTLFIQDDTISDTKKQELVSLYKPSDSRLLFLAKVLSFGMERQFIKRDTRNQKLIAGGVLSPIVLDYIMDSEVPKPCRHFLGREEELDELHTLFEENRHIFLYGIAGIGKSELAKAYAKQYRKQYTNILYMEYTGNLYQDIVDMDFIDDPPEISEQERFQRHNRFLRSLKSDTLLIIDNFNVTSTQDSCLSVVLKYRCRVLFTTRSQLSEYCSFQLKELKDIPTLFQLTSVFYSEAEENRAIVEKIIETVHYHTFAVELAAKLLENGILTPEQLLIKQLLFQAECSTEKDMASLSRKYDQMDKNLDILDSQDMALKEQLEKDAVAFQEEKLRPKPEQYTELLDARIQIRPTFREKLIEQLKGTFGEYYDYHYRDIATHEVDDLNMEDPYSFSHRTWELEYQRKQELQKKHPVQSRQKSHNTEL